MPLSDADIGYQLSMELAREVHTLLVSYTKRHEKMLRHLGDGMSFGILSGALANQLCVCLFKISSDPKKLELAYSKIINLLDGPVQERIKELKESKNE